MRSILLTISSGLLVAASPLADAWASLSPAACGLTTIDPISGVKIEACLNLAYRPADVWVRGDFAYVASQSSSSVFVYDISNLASPTQVREITGPGAPATVSDVVVGENDVVYISYYCALGGCSPVHKSAKAQTCPGAFATSTIADPADIDPDEKGMHNFRYDHSTGTLFGAFLDEVGVISQDGVAWWDVGTASCAVTPVTHDDTTDQSIAGTHDIFIQDVGPDKFLLAADSERVSIHDITGGPSTASFIHNFTCNNANVCTHAHTVWPIDDIRLTLTDEASGGRLLGLLRTSAFDLVQKGGNQIPLAKSDSYHQQAYEAPFLYAAAYQAGVRIWKKDANANLFLYAYFDTSNFGGLGGSSLTFTDLAGAYAAHPAKHGLNKRYFVVTQHQGNGQLQANSDKLFILSLDVAPGTCGPQGCKTSKSASVPSSGGSSALLVASSTDNSSGRLGTLASYASGAAGFGSPVSITQSGLTIDHRYGHALVVGDFNGDGRQDAAVGAPGQAVGAIAGGLVYVYHGTAAGYVLATTLSASASGLATSALGDQFGYSLATGDFNGDGFADLAVGTPGAADSSDVQAGAAFIYHGAAAGLTAQTRLVPGTPRLEDDRFGSALASADFNGDGAWDLAVGAPRGKFTSTSAHAGTVFVYRGAIGGLTFAARKNQRGLDVDEPGDNFGASLATGDFDGDGLPDLAVGAWGEHLVDLSAGAVYTFLGTRTSSVLVAWSQLEQSGTDVNEEEDMFGWELAAGDFTGDGISDLVVGAPGEMPASAPRSGGVHLFEGSTASLGAVNLVDQTGFSTNDDQEAFGQHLAAGDFDRDGLADVAVLAPGLVSGDSGNPAFVYRGAPAGLGTWQTVPLP